MRRPYSVMLGPVPGICCLSILNTVADPRDKPEDDVAFDGICTFKKRSAFPVFPLATSRLSKLPF